MKTCFSKSKAAPKPQEWYGGFESVLAHLQVGEASIDAYADQIYFEIHLDWIPNIFFLYTVWTNNFLEQWDSNFILISAGCIYDCQRFSPLFVVKVAAAVVEEDVTVLSERSLHHPDATVEKALKLWRVQNLLPLLFCQFPQHRKRIYNTIYKNK